MRKRFAARTPFLPEPNGGYTVPKTLKTLSIPFAQSSICP